MKKLKTSEKDQIFESLRDENLEKVFKKIRDFFDGINNFSDYIVRSGEDPVDLRAIHTCTCGNETDLGLARYRADKRSETVSISEGELGSKIEHVSYQCSSCGKRNVFKSKDRILINIDAESPIIAYGDLNGTKYVAMSQSVAFLLGPLSGLETGEGNHKKANIFNHAVVVFENGDVSTLTRSRGSIIQTKEKTIPAFFQNKAFLNYLDSEKDKIISHIKTDCFLKLKNINKYGAEFAFLLSNDAGVDVEFRGYGNIKEAAGALYEKYKDSKHAEKLVELSLLNPDIVQLEIPDKSEFIDLGGNSDHFYHKEFWHKVEKYKDFCDRVIVRYFSTDGDKLIETHRLVDRNMSSQFYGNLHKSALENSFLSKFSVDQIKSLCINGIGAVSSYSYDLFYGKMDQIWSIFDNKDWIFKFAGMLVKIGDEKLFNPSSVCSNMYGKTPKEITGYSPRIIRYIFGIFSEMLSDCNLYDHPVDLINTFFKLSPEAKELIHNFSDKEIEYVFKNLCSGCGCSTKLSTIIENISLKKIEPYLQDCQYRQRIERNNAILIWSDYLYFAKGAGLNLNKKTKFPFSLKLAHDQAAYSYQIMRSKEKIENFTKRVLSEEYRSFETDTDTLVMISPSKSEDLSKEGSSLSHCVGSYVDQIADGTNIYFVRKKSSPDKSFATVEIHPKLKIVIQCRGFDNKDMMGNHYIKELFKKMREQEKIK